MTRYQNTKYDFKRYLLDNLNDTHQDELIFWKKSIPLPIDLVYKIFDEGNALIEAYCGHIMSLAIMEKYYTEIGVQTNSLFDLPSANSLDGINSSEIYKKYIQNSAVSNLKELLKRTFKFKDFFLSESDFVLFIKHEGRKYRRLYVPRNLKNQISSLIPNINSSLGVSNGDMFGNIVADYLKIYRSGFSDAFAAIFNKLLDFNIENNEEVKEAYSNHNQITVHQVSDSDSDSKYSIRLDKINDGSLWEPAYIEAKTIMKLNSNHPYWDLVKSNKVNSVRVLEDILIQLSHLEYESVKDSNRKFLENIRFEISRSLRLIAEMEMD
jgi:hypothetical protein